MKAGGTAAPRAVALAAYAALLAASAPAWPDDWDGVGFLASVHDFDLARFHPHPPGYPVYVALLRLAALVAGSPMRAALVVAVASGALAAALVYGSARRAGGERAGVAAAGLVAVAPLSWRACSGVGSEAPALAMLAACAWALIAARTPAEGKGRGASVLLGVAAGLGLGVRLSWAPLYLAALALVPASARVRAWTAAAASTAAWAVPLLAVVGPSRLAQLYGDHLSGHASRWGGTIVTEPGWVRLEWLSRDLFVDGLGVDGDALGLALGALVVAAAACALVAWRRAHFAGAGAFAFLGAPYLAWIALGQNLRDQPRHALPLVALLAAGLAVAALRHRRGPVVVAALALAMAARTTRDAWARRTIPPPGQQLVDLVRAQPSPERSAVFGTTSIRFFEGTELEDHAFPAGSLGDAQVRLTRLPALPVRLWLTSEVPFETTRWPLDRVATLCRPARIDRRRPCLDVYEWKVPYLPSLR